MNALKQTYFRKCIQTNLNRKKKTIKVYKLYVTFDHPYFFYWKIATKSAVYYKLGKKRTATNDFSLTTKSLTAIFII